VEICGGVVQSTHCGLIFSHRGAFPTQCTTYTSFCSHVLERTVLEYNVLVPYGSDSYLTCSSPVQPESVWSLLKAADQFSEICM
jgi:hypothetical protein